MKLFPLFLITFVLSVADAATQTWYFRTGWVSRNPDGLCEREVIGFNDTWPLPILRARRGDTINLYLTNGFDDRNTSLHFHGMFQNGTNQMDGPEMVTQCPIPPGETMLYNFTLDQSGTYWYHSHTTGQYGDGMRQAFIIEDDDFPYEYDEEVVLTIGEWYHQTADELIPTFLNRYNPTGAEPIPQNTLFNDTRNNTWVVEPGRTYFLRIVNVGKFVSQYLYMEGHEFEIVEVDGVFVERNTTEMLYITVAQRYGVLVRTRNDTSRNYAFMNKIDDTMLDVIPSDLLLNSTNYIVYDEDADMPDEHYVDSIDDYFDDFYLRPLSRERLYDDADYTVTVDVVMDNLGNGVNYAFFNNITYTKPRVPTLVTVMSADEHANNELVYGTNTNAFVLQKGDVVDIVLNNQDTGRHPFHLHGHVFQLIERHEEIPEDQSPVGYDKDNHAEWPEYPMMRDTVYVLPQSYMVMRFVADNPGVWFFHCHIEWHLDQGLALTFIEAPMEMQETETQQLSDSFVNACEKVGMSVRGNAAGNSRNFLDLQGQNVQHAPLPAGFTARGIVALVFSCIAAFVGIVAISVYGMADIKDVEERVAHDLNVDFLEDEDATNENESNSISEVRQSIESTK